MKRVSSSIAPNITEGVGKKVEKEFARFQLTPLNIK